MINRRFNFLIVTLFLVILPSQTVAGEITNFYTLEKSIKEAMTNNWQLKTKLERVEQAGSRKNQARADFLPKFGTTYGYKRLSEPLVQGAASARSVPIGDQDNYQWTGFISQPVFKGFALISSYRLADLGIDRSQLELELEKLDLALQVKQSYFNVLAADKGVEVAQSDVESRTSNANVAKSFYEVGMIPINDLLKAEVELANVEQVLVRVKSVAQTTRSAFNTVLARGINEPVEIEDILTYKPEKVDYEDNLKRALTERPEIKILDVNLLQADEQIRLAKSRNYPEVNLDYQYVKQGDSPDVSGSDFKDAGYWQASATLTWTFWEWGKTYYSAREQESLKKQLLDTKSDVEDGIRFEVKQATLDLDVAEKNIPTTIKAVQQAEENLRVNEERYKAQVTTITEVLDAQALLTQARTNYYKALYDHNLARARLLRSLGEY